MRITDLKKSFGDKEVLKGINLQLVDNEVLCVMGVSGAGKTTLLNAVAGLYPYEGKISPVRVAYVFQTDRLIPYISVKKNLEFVMGDRLTSQEKAEQITKMLTLAGLEGTEDLLPTKLSGGMAQRVAFVRAFLCESDVVLMDEPFRSLDVSSKRMMARLFNTLMLESPKKVLFVTHDVDEALYFGDRIAVLKDGVISNEIINRKPRRDRELYSTDSDMRAKLVREFIEE